MPWIEMTIAPRLRIKACLSTPGVLRAVCIPRENVSKQPYGLPSSLN